MLDVMIIGIRKFGFVAKVPFTIYFTGDTDNKYVHSKTFKKPA